MGFEWNEEQTAIINARGRDLLVSASAGSGKTTVMLERVRQLIIGDRVPIKRIVILSFNESIAAEIKSKLYAMLEGELEGGGHGYAQNAFIEEQLDAIDRADISTMDAFANRLIREYFDRLGLDPSVAVGDVKENEARLKKSVRAVVKNAREQGDEEYYELRSKLGGDKSLEDAILKAYYYATVQSDAEGWLRRAHELYGKAIDDTGLIGEYVSRFGAWYGEACEGLKELLMLSGASREKAAAPYLVLDIVNKISGSATYRDLYYAVNADIPKQSYKNAIFGEYNRDISALTKRLIEAINEARQLFAAPPDEAEEIHRSIAADARKIGELALEVMREYRRVRDEAAVIDFADMTYYAARLLGDHGTAEEIRSRYDYIFVDEYQDQNYIAEYILSRISRDNLFAVGDVKQSIYGFRLAEPAIMLSRADSYAAEDMAQGRAPSDSKVIRLNTNYRSDKAILEAVNGVFDTAMKRSLCGVDYAETERFRALAEYPSNGAEKFKCVFFVKGGGADGDSEESEAESEEKASGVAEPFNPNKRVRKAKERGAAEDEGEFIADKIEELAASGIYDKKIGAMRPLNYNDICLLSRERLGEGTELDSVINVLLSRGYPVDCSGVIKNKEVKEVELIIDMLRVIDNTTDEIPLAAALLSVWGGLTSKELYEIRRANPSLPFADAIRVAAPRNEKVARFYALIDRCRGKLARRRLADVVAMLVYDYGYESALMRDRVKLRCVQQFIASLEGYGGSLSEYLSAADASVEYDGSADSAESKFIQTSTIHKSKGLEYPVVFLVGAGKRFNLRAEPLVTFKSYGIGLGAFDSSTLAKRNAFACDALNIVKREEERNEEMRLLYVAMSRAMNHLYISGVLPKSNSEAASYTLPNKVMCYKDWLANAVAAGSLPKECVEVREAEAGQGEEVQIVELRRDITFAKAAIDEYVNKPYLYRKATSIGLKHTVTELVSERAYEDKFIYKPTDFGEDERGLDKARRGTNYHAILEHIDYAATTPELVREELERMSRQGLLDGEQIEEVDVSEIAAIMNSEVIALARVTPHRREQEFTLAVKAREFFDCDTEDEVIVQGAIDLIIMGTELIIVDFKKSNKSREELIAAYSLQLRLYARAAEEALGKRVKKMIIYSISARKAIEIKDNG